MADKLTISATLPAWLPSHERIDTILRLIKEGKHGDALSRLHLTSYDMAKGSNPWARCGEASVTLTLESRDTLVAAQVKALQAELDHARAEWLTRQQEILDRISKLQALDYTPEAA
jgi:hypothetical protein